MDYLDIYVFLLAALGLVYLAFFLLDSFWSLLQMAHALLAPYLLANEDNSLLKKYGNWALVTGCTDGIGKAYVIELAKRNVNVVLVSRSEDKLKDMAQLIENQYSVKTKTVAADFTDVFEAVEKIKKAVANIPVSILVNNVGKQYEYPMCLGEVPEKELWDIIKINVGAVTLMSRAFVEEMRKVGRGAIVNVSSGSELQPLPLMTVYAATKAYIKSFSAALRYEYAESGITVQHLSPMFVNTKMNSFSNRLQESSFFVPNATTYAKYAVATLGKMDESTGFWTHGIQEFFTKIPPTWIRMHIGAHMNKLFRKDFEEKAKAL